MVKNGVNRDEAFCGGDAGTGVAHAEHGLPSRRAVATMIFRGRPGRQAAHRLHGVGDEIEQHLLQLVAVAEDHDGRRVERLLELDAVQLQLVDDEQRGARGHVVQVHRRLLGHALPGEGEQVADDPTGPLRLIVDDAQMLPRKIGMQLALEQQLGQAGDGGERVVELVRHARDQLADRGHLVVLDELRLHDALLGHVLDQHDHGPGAGALGERRGGEPEHPARALEPGDDGRGPLAPLRGLDQLRHDLGGPPQRLGEAPPDQLRLGGLGQRRQRAIGAEHRVPGSDDGDAFGQRVEGRLPFLLAAPHDLVQPAVGQHHRGVGGHGREQPQVFGGERPALAVGDRERAHRDALGAERRHRRRAHGQPADQVHRGLRRPLGHLDPLALDGEAHERAVGILGDLSR